MHGKIRLEVATLAFAASLSAFSGCGPATGDPPKPNPVANLRPDDPLKDVTLENESANMDKIKKAGEGRK